MFTEWLSNIISSIKDMINELKSLQFASFSDVFIKMVYSLIFIALLLGIFQLINYLIIFMFKMLIKINIQSILAKYIGA